MNPALTTGLLISGKGIENNALSPPDGLSVELGNELFEGEFSEVLSDLLSVDGKLKPLDLAALKEFGIQELSDLQVLIQTGFPPESLDSEQLSLLNHLLGPELNKQIENVDLFGNPDVKALLNPNVINDELLDEGVLNNKPLNKPELLAGKLISSDDLHQSILKKDADLSHVFDDINFSKIIKEAGKSDIDLGSEFLAQTAKQEINAVKLVDQFASVDKSINPVSSLNNHSLKPYSGLEQSATTLNRIEVPVAQPGWGEAVGNRLMMMVNAKVQSANIHLNPAELGPIEIRVSVNNEHASVHFVSNNSVVRDAIEDAFPRLKEMFSQNGLSLADANVSQQSSQHGGRYSNEQNDPLMMLNNESVDTVDIQTQSNNVNMIDIGLVDQYV